MLSSDSTVFINTGSRSYGSVSAYDFFSACTNPIALFAFNNPLITYF